MIEDGVELPVRFRVLQYDELERLYFEVGLSAREIARRAEVSPSTVLACLRRSEIEIRGDDLPHRSYGQVPFGWELRGNRLVTEPAEQKIIRMIRQYASTGKSLRAIAKELNRRLIPTKNNGIWQANTVRKILRRVYGEKQRVPV